MLSIIIPCYNEAENIGEVVRELLEAVQGWRQLDCEIIVVDDASTDESYQVLMSCDGIRVIRHARNMGYGSALKTGIRAAVGDIVLTMDADGQHAPEYIPALVEGMDGADMVVGSRVDASGVPLVRKPGKRVLQLLMNYILGTEIEDINSGMRAMRREVILKYLHVCSNRFSFSISSTMAMVSDARPVRFVPIICRPRAGNKSRVSLVTAFDTLLRIIRLGTVFRPMRVFLPPAMIVGGVACMSLATDLYQRNIHDVTIFLGLGSLLIFCFALLSDQVSAILRNLR